jgi:hypothetical protein
VRRYAGARFDFDSLHRMHKLMAKQVFALSWVHTVCHVCRIFVIKNPALFGCVPPIRTNDLVKG